MLKLKHKENALKIMSEIGVNSFSIEYSKVDGDATFMSIYANEKLDMLFIDSAVTTSESFKEAQVKIMPFADELVDAIVDVDSEGQFFINVLTGNIQLAATRYVTNTLSRMYTDVENKIYDETEDRESSPKFDEDMLADNNIELTADDRGRIINELLLRWRDRDTDAWEAMYKEIYRLHVHGFQENEKPYSSMTDKELIEKWVAVFRYDTDSTDLGYYCETVLNSPERGEELERFIAGRYYKEDKSETPNED